MTLSRTKLATAGLMLLVASAGAAPFEYNDRDLMLTFRKSGKPDFEVNIGSFSTYASATLPFTVGGYTPIQLTSILGSTDSLSWSVVGAVRPGLGDAAYPANTLWLTKPRSDALNPTLAYERRSSSTQSAISSSINGIAGNGSIAGALSWSSGTPADPLTNTRTAVAIPSGDPNSYTQLAGGNGTLNGTFGQGSVENTVPPGGALTSSDLYEVLPGTGKAKLLGHFDLMPNGSMVFVPVPEPGTMALLGLGGLFLFARARSTTKPQANS